MPPKKNVFKKEKLEERILSEVNTLFRSKMGDKRLQFVSITKVELNEDYSVAKIFWDTFDSGLRGDAKAAIESAKGKIRSSLAKTLDTRIVPHLLFYYDSRFESENAINELLKSEAKDGKGF